MGAVSADWDLLAVGRPSVDVMFSGLEAWPELGRDVLASGLGVCAGTSFNTPAAANRLGLRVGYVAMAGTDRWSRVVLEEWEAEALPKDLLLVADRPMPFVSVALNRDGERGFVTYYGATPSDDAELLAFAQRVIATADARHLHTYAGKEHEELVRAAKRRGMTVSLDAWGGPWWRAEAPLPTLLEHADVVFANADEARAMTGEPDVGRAAARLAEIVDVAVVKLGASGALAVAGGERHEVPAEPAEVLDATGAGDCFNAGFLRGWLAGLPLPHCLTLGAICGARAVQAFGGYRGCPREAELRELAATRGIELPPLRGGDP
ncbi:MAG: sugar kinase [Actinomycetota bacterium]|nr:MAG: sugar kinase [Actinomycetota bacterium]